jgi:hypothetical protein
MLEKDDTLYFSSIIFNRYQDTFWNNLYSEAPEGGKFFIDLARRINPCRFVTRNGEWQLPWNQEIPIGFEMPDYDPFFSMSFSEVTDRRAQEIKSLIVTNNQKFAVMYSGGIDSTLILCSLIKNLSEEELKNIAVCTSSHAIIENPNFFLNFVKDKFTIIDSNTHKYDDLIEMSYRPITADEGDCIFGTILGLSLYNNYDYLIDSLSDDSKRNLRSIKNKFTDDSVHYSQYKDVIIKHFSIASNPKFGERFYEKFEKNIQTATVPIYSLHDYFWWMIFNIKYLNCSVRGAVYFNDRIHCKEAINDWIINWFNGREYQLWSMANNNNGEKIGLTASTYKMAARKYIHEIDRNPWYFNFKIKLESLGGSVVVSQKLDHLPVKQRPNARFGLDKDYNVLFIDDPAVQRYIIEHILKYSKEI